MPIEIRKLVGCIIMRDTIHIYVYISMRVCINVLLCARRSGGGGGGNGVG